MKINIANWGLDAWRTGDAKAVIEEIRLADRKGIYQYNIPDHILFVANPRDYPYAKNAGTEDFDGGMPFDPKTLNFLEPLTLFAAAAAVTKNIRLATAVLIAPLRHAVFLAKQVATLDHISNGRVDLAVGSGWLKEELEALNAPAEKRMDYMIDQIKVCRALWSHVPTSIHNRAANFDDVFCLPLPVQKPLPVWLGVALNARNIERIADVADGWMGAPIERDWQPAQIREPIRALRRAFEARGRDPASATVQVTPAPVLGSNGKADLEATLKRIPKLEEAGVDVISLYTHQYISHSDDYEAFLDRVVRFGR